MSSHPPQPFLPSSATGRSDQKLRPVQPLFLETLEHRRFAEFLESCRLNRSIGLCYGAPGVGKTLSARHASHADRVEGFDLLRSEPIYGLPIHTAFVTAAVVNTSAQVEAGILAVTEKLAVLARGPLMRQAERALDTIRLRNENYRWAHAGSLGARIFEEPPLEPTYSQVIEQFEQRRRLIGDPTSLLVVDEADRLRFNSLEQVRALYNRGRFGLVLLGMPELEKRLARYPQLYSLIGFVHEFRPLANAELRSLLGTGLLLGCRQSSVEATAAIARITGGNFRLLDRLLAQVDRILAINVLQESRKRQWRRHGRAW
jgi:hypothetical protein